MNSTYQSAGISLGMTFAFGGLGFGIFFRDQIQPIASEVTRWIAALI